MVEINAEVNKIRWLLLKQLEEVVLNCEMYIFGGYIRDKIRHDHFATEFYNHESIKVLTNEKTIQEKYNDKTCLPEYIDRLSIPSDIDCFMQKKLDMNKLSKELMKKRLIWINNKTSKASFYIKIKEDKKITSEKILHTKLEIGFAINSAIMDVVSNLEQYHIKIDIIHALNDIELDIGEIITSNIDFECNGLVITPDKEYKLASSLSTLYLSDPLKKHNKISQIINDIISSKAMLIGTNALSYRVRKMLNKNWHLYTERLTVIKPDNNYETEVETCLICHDDLKKSEYHIKHSKCSARYHCNCYNIMTQDLNFNEKCPVCNDELYYNDKDFVTAIEKANIELRKLRENNEENNEEREDRLHGVAPNVVKNNRFWFMPAVANFEIRR